MERSLAEPSRRLPLGFICKAERLTERDPGTGAIPRSIRPNNRYSRRV